MATVLLSPSAKQQFFDNAGAPAAGFKLHTYAAGTTNPQATYQDRAGLSANSNPIILDARGEAIIYLTPGVMYDYALTTAGDSPVWTRANVSADAGDADAVAYLAPGVGAVTRTSNAKMGEQVSVMDRGAVADGVTDCTDAFQKAINDALTLGRGTGTVYVPTGRYFFAEGSPRLDPGEGNVTFYGDGMFNSILAPDLGTDTNYATHKHLFNNETTSLKGNVQFLNLGFEGNWTARGEVEGGGAPIRLDYYNSITVQGCRFFDFGGISIQCEAIRTVNVVGNLFERGCLDMCRFRSSFDVTVVGNSFKHCDDDPVALHQADYITGTDIREGIVVSNNTFEDTGCIRILGARMANVTNNVMRRPKNGGIQIFYEAGESDCTTFGVNVNNNSLYDVIERPSLGTNATYAIIVASNGRKAGSSSGGVVPGEQGVGGVFVQPYPYRNDAYSVAADSLPPTWSIRVCDNIIRRTLPAGMYSSWGYGLAMTRDGFQDFNMTDGMLRLNTGIRLEGDVRKCEVSGNEVGYVFRGISFNAPTYHFALDSTMVHHNRIWDFTVAGIEIDTPTGVMNTNALIESNMLDGDPMHTHPNRGATGTWLAAGDPAGIHADNIAGLQIRGNHFQNVSWPIRMNWEDRNYILSNIQRCFPFALGFNVGNQGVGIVSTAGVQWLHEVYDCNPASATYKVQLNPTLQVSSGLPTSGRYVAGQFVQNTNFALGHYGYVRLTVGTAHVSGTDWKTVAMA